MGQAAPIKKLEYVEDKELFIEFEREAWDFKITIEWEDWAGKK